jgi:hypothetical protein
MTTLAAAATGLTAKPKPVLFFDACDILNIVRCLEDKQAHRVYKAAKLVAQLAQNPDCLQLVTSFVVEMEFQQTLQHEQTKVEKHLRLLDEQIQHVYEAWNYFSQPLAGNAPRFAGPPDLVAPLVDLAGQILRQTLILDTDSACEKRALQRVFNRVRPSHKKEIKDSIHLELCQEFVRQLRSSGFGERCFFVSYNKNDYCTDKFDPKLHPDLVPEFDALNLEFFWEFERALSELGI